MISLLLCVTGFLAPADDVSDAARKELDKLQGTWKMVSLEQRGQKADEDVVSRYTLTIKGDQWTVSTGVGGGTTTHTIRIDPTKGPRTLDLMAQRGDEENVSHGIYKLEGDTLTLCRTSGPLERPKEFKTTTEAGILVVWKRADK